MPRKATLTDEQRLENRRAYARKYYQSRKNDEDFKERQRQYKKKFNDSNRELVALKSKEFYWSNESYRNAKLDKLADRYSNDDEYRQKTILAARKRYWDKRTKDLAEADGDAKSTDP